MGWFKGFFWHGFHGLHGFFKGGFVRGAGFPYCRYLEGVERTGGDYRDASHKSAFNADARRCSGFSRSEPERGGRFG